jgi:predicted alpha/beta hydrolase
MSGNRPPVAQDHAGFQFVDIVAGRRILTGKLYLSTDKPDLAVVVHAATGVTQDYYEPFARWLSAQLNAAVLTYDYRETGLSRGAEPVQRLQARLSDWGIHDQNGALNHLCERFPNLPVWVIGHSLGGLFLRWHDNAHRVSRLLTVASGPAHYLSHPVSSWPSVFWFWFAGGPALTGTFGYLPGRSSGLGADLPAPAFWQWRRWCTSRGFYEIDWGKAFGNPGPVPEGLQLNMFSFSDDWMIPPKSVSRLRRYYPGVETRHSTLSPHDFGLRKLGHVGLFARKNAVAWPALVDPATG